MKREKLLTFLTGWLLAALIAWSAVSCLISGFSLQAKLALFPLCLMFGGVCAFAFSWKRGGTVLLCVAAVWAGFLWRDGTAWQQLLGLIYQISVIYDQAYGWGVPQLRGVLAVDYPAAILAALTAAAAARTVCRQKSALVPLILGALPLAACLVVTDRVPEEKYLYCLMLGLLVLLFAGTVRRRGPDQFRRLTWMAAPAVAAALGLLFWLVPQENYVNRSGEIQETVLTWLQQIPSNLEQTAQELFSGADGTLEQPDVDLSAVGPRIQLDYPVLEVLSTQSGTLYLREQDYDIYSGTGWTASAGRTEAFPAQASGAGTVEIQTRGTRDSLLIPYYPGTAVTLVDGRVNNAENSRSYTFSLTALPADWHSTATAGAGGGLYYTAGNGTDYLALPAATKEWAQSLLDTILTYEQTDTQKAETIAAYVRNSALYDLKTARMSGDSGDFARWFLEESDTGYCVHFATATAVLLRAAGVQARYVTGYMTQTVAGETVTVTADQAHAWVEYYDHRLGCWLVLESTPADLSQGEDTVPSQTAGTESQTVPTEPEGETAPAQTRPSAEEPGTEETPPAKFQPGPWLKGLLLAAFLVLAVLGQWKFRLARRAKALDRGRPNARALARWREAERLARLLGETPPAELEDLAQKAKFSSHTLTAEELDVFGAYLDQCRGRLRERNFLWQLVYRFVLAVY